MSHFAAPSLVVFFDCFFLKRLLHLVLFTAPTRDGFLFLSLFCPATGRRKPLGNPGRHFHELHECTFRLHIYTFRLRTLYRRAGQACTALQGHMATKAFVPVPPGPLLAFPARTATCRYFVLFPLDFFAFEIPKPLVNCSLCAFFSLMGGVLQTV